MENIISVVIVTYNQEDTIRRSIDSVLMQKCHLPFEIVIGEDCSTDSTRAICEAYARQYPDIIRLFCNDHNKGLVDNYYDSLLACRGRYIADCAGDDFWIDPQKLEKEVCVMEAHPDVSMVLTNWQFYNEQTRETTPSRQIHHAPITPGRQLLKAIITQQHMSVFHLCTSLYRTDIFRQAYHDDTHLFRSKDYCSEDMQVAFSMALHGDIAYLPDVTLNYSIGGKGISNIHDEEKLFRFARKSTLLTRDLASKHQIDISDFLSQRLFELGMHAFRTHQPALYQETLTCEKEWNVPRTIKNTLLMTVMGHKTIWKIGLWVRQAVVSLKR